MALVEIDDEYDKLIENFVAENRRDYPSKKFYINNLIKQDFKKRGIMNG